MSRPMKATLITVVFVCVAIAYAATRSAIAPNAEIIARLAAIETRLTHLESQAPLVATEVATSWVDKHGIIRSPTGEPIGWWGVDDPEGY